MKLWVIMMNDYPEGVTAAGEEAARAAMEEMKRKRVERLTHGGYWRLYEFEDCVLSMGTVIE